MGGQTFETKCHVFGSQTAQGRSQSKPFHKRVVCWSLVTDQSRGTNHTIYFANWEPGACKSCGAIMTTALWWKVGRESWTLLKKANSLIAKTFKKNLILQWYCQTNTCVGDFGHVESKPCLYLGLTINYCFTGIWPFVVQTQDSFCRFSI